MRVLQVEDDERSARATELGLSSRGIQVYSVPIGEEGVDLAKLYDYDLIIVDLGLPDMTGSDLIRLVRRAKVSTPILVLTGENDQLQKVRALEGGADDYLTKPFSIDELAARVQALVRRSRGYSESELRVGNMVVDLGKREANISGHPLWLTPREYQMLELLTLRRGLTVTKEAFLNHMYGGMDEPEVKIIDVYVCKIRKKMTAVTTNNVSIETVWGRGYVLREAPAGLQNADRSDNATELVLQI
jgi:two-component system, cell cycle response regulator CtrA